MTNFISPSWEIPASYCRRLISASCDIIASSIHAIRIGLMKSMAIYSRRLRGEHQPHAIVSSISASNIWMKFDIILRRKAFATLFLLLVGGGEIPRIMRLQYQHTLDDWWSSSHFLTKLHKANCLMPSACSIMASLHHAVSCHAYSSNTLYHNERQSRECLVIMSSLPMVTWRLGIDITPASVMKYSAPISSWLPREIGSTISASAAPKLPDAYQWLAWNRARHARSSVAAANLLARH